MTSFVKNKILPYILITRPLNLLIIIAAVYLGYAISKNNFSLNIFDLVMFAPIVLSAAAGYCLNDLTDLEEDRINRPGRILVRNLISKRICIAYIIFLFCLSIIISIFRPILLISNTALFGMILFYSFSLKKTPVAGNIATSLLSSFPVIWGSLSAGTFTKDILYVSLLAFSLHLPREIIKDMEDYRGDFSAGKKTTAVFFGMKTAFLISCFLLCLSLFAVIFVFLFFFKGSYLAYIAISAISIALLSGIFALFRNKPNFSSNFVRFAMIISVIFLFFGIV